MLLSSDFKFFVSLFCLYVCLFFFFFFLFIFFFQAEDDIRDAQESLGLGDVYKRQVIREGVAARHDGLWARATTEASLAILTSAYELCLIHI